MVSLIFKALFWGLSSQALSCLIGKVRSKAVRPPQWCSCCLSLSLGKQCPEPLPNRDFCGSDAPAAIHSVPCFSSRYSGSHTQLTYLDKSLAHVGTRHCKLDLLWPDMPVVSEVRQPCMIGGIQREVFGVLKL